MREACGNQQTSPTASYLYPISMYFSVAQTRLIANQCSHWFVQILHRLLMCTVNTGSVCFSKLLVLPCQTTHRHAVLFNYIWSCDIHWRCFI